MLNKSFIDKAKVGLCMLLAVTGAYYITVFKFHASSLLSIKEADAQSISFTTSLEIETWWPTDGSHIQGVLPFKGLVKNTPVEQYNMYWKVDDGGLVPMASNYTDYPHKEANVDISSWNWRGQGPYKITYIAKNLNGEQIAEKAINIYNDGATASVPAPAPIVVISTPLAVTTSISAAITPIATPIQPIPEPTPVLVGPVIAPTVTPTISSTPTPSPAPAPTNVAVNAALNVWWPSDSASVSGTQPFKALAEGTALSDYTMYWQVDGGSLSLMNDDQDGYPHKETSVNISSWTWKGRGPYTVTFVAKNNNNQIIGTKNVSVFNSDAADLAVQPISQPALPVLSLNPLTSLKLYIDPNNPAAKQANNWRSYRSADASQMDKIASQPIAKWLGGWSGDVAAVARDTISKAKSQNETPVFIAYNIPARDCGSYSAGGANSPDGYRSWITSLKNGIGNNKAVVILEPDALASISCLSQNDQNTRYKLIRDAVTTLKSNSNTIVYLDAGNSAWISATDMATRLKNAGIDNANGFSLNVSNFTPTLDNTAYGTKVSALVGNKHFVIDTSRNGNGSNGEWCNPNGRALGQRPTTSTGNSLVDSYLWLKQPGESDGSCNGGPSAGSWWAEYALGLAQRAQF